MDLAPQLIGVDIGGSGARAACVERDEEGELCVGELHALTWDDGFTPLPLEEQLRYPGEVPALEEIASGARVARLAELILSCTDHDYLSCHVAAPGLLTEDGYGVEVWRNGPRRSTLISDLKLAVESQRRALKCDLSPISPDSLACTLGEQAAQGGALREASNALCIAGGSGVGEGVIVEGRCFGLPELEPPLARAWELTGDAGASLEDQVAPGRVLEAWKRAGREGAPEEQGSDEAAAALLDARDRGVVRLVERADAWFRMRGLELERVVLSQTLGRLYSEDGARFGALAEALGGVELVTSSLRGAPLAGAVARGSEARS
ncbi:MAG: hypothetical protein MK291_06115 [Planctomycetes bacterium]|nr:hypothetical protein [Planctomycetota bacterium]